jgi:hypothetical protein
MKRFFFGLFLGLAGGIFALQNHVVRTHDGMVVISRTSKPPISSAYLDVRDWSVTMWQQYPDVAAAVVQAGRTDLITENALGSFLNGMAPENKGTPATSTSSVFEAPLRLLQGNLSSGGAPATESSGTTDVTAPVTNVLTQISTSVKPTETGLVLPQGVPVEAVLGVPGNFPEEFLKSAPSTSLGSMLTPAPSGDASSRDATESMLKAVPQPIQDRAAGQDPDWVRGLLRSLVPVDGASLPATQGTPTGYSSPVPAEQSPPSAAIDLLRPVGFQQFDPHAPLQAIRQY